MIGITGDTLSLLREKVLTHSLPSARYSVLSNTSMVALIIGELIVILTAIVFIFILYRKLKADRDQLRLEKNMRQSFFNISDRIIFLKDEHFRYIYVNAAFEQFHHIKAAQVIGKDDGSLFDQELAVKCRETDLEALRQRRPVDSEISWSNRAFSAIKFPVSLGNGRYGVGAMVKDITVEKKNKSELEKTLQRNVILVDVLNRDFYSSQEQLDFVLGEALKLTESRYGYIYLYDETAQTFTLNSWSKDVMPECSVMEKQTIYYLEKTGIWGEVVRQRKPIIVNDFQAPNSLKKGYPKGHVSLQKYMSVPVFRDGRIVAVVGLANKAEDYDQNDIDQTIALMNGAWNAKEKRETALKIEYLSFHDPLTGLYNRRFFEQELNRLDTHENQPIAILMADINGLKFINDIFGHNFGDMLLVNATNAFKAVCRKEDIIARWGGDEFIIFLPQTDTSDARTIKKRIKNEFSKQHIKSIKGTVSVGFAAKQASDENIYVTIETAENRMYSEKTLECAEVKHSILQTIIHTLFETCPNEKGHAERVKQLCGMMGKELGLEETQITKLENAAFLHDIGKVTIDPRLLTQADALTAAEQKIIRQHPLTGYRILNYSDETLGLAESVLSHHENWDGSGYPKGLEATEIPESSRIIALAEGYDWFMHQSDEQRSLAEGLQYIRENAGLKYDPDIAEQFIRILKKGMSPS